MKVMLCHPGARPVEICAVPPMAVDAKVPEATVCGSERTTRLHGEPGLRPDAPYAMSAFATVSPISRSRFSDIAGAVDPTSKTTSLNAPMNVSVEAALARTVQRPTLVKDMTPVALFTEHPVVPSLRTE